MPLFCFINQRMLSFKYFLFFLLVAQIVELNCCLLSDIYPHYGTFMDTEQVHSSSESVPYLKPDVFSRTVHVKKRAF